MSRAPSLPLLRALLPAAACLLAVSCGSSTSTDVTAPSTTRCQPSLSGSSTTFPPSGGTGSVSVNVSRECAWSAASLASWIEITSEREGQGSGTVSFRVRENGDPVLRRGSLAVSEQRVDVAQEAAPCRYEVQFPDGQVPAEGGQMAVPVGTHGACRWTAASQAPWVTLAPQSGTGPATVDVTIAPNSGAPRSVTIVIAGQALSITQAAVATPAPPPPAPNPPAPSPQPGPAPCAYSITPSQRSFEAEGGSGSASMSTGAGCTWAAASSATWVVILSGSSGTGSGEIRYTVAPNLSTSAREATITASGVSHRVSQAGASTSGPPVELEGPVAGLSGSCPTVRFTIRGTVVSTDAATKYDDGRCADLRNGRSVDIKGVRLPDGSVYAREVEFDD